jgi:hypothetical protein
MAHELDAPNLWYGEIAADVVRDLERTGRTVDRWSSSSGIAISWSQHVNGGNRQLKVEWVTMHVYFVDEHARVFFGDIPTGTYEYANPAFPDNLRERLGLSPCK